MADPDDVIGQEARGKHADVMRVTRMLDQERHRDGASAADTVGHAHAGDCRNRLQKFLHNPGLPVGRAARTRSTSASTSASTV